MRLNQTHKTPPRLIISRSGATLRRHWLNQVSILRSQILRQIGRKSRRVRSAGGRRCRKATAPTEAAAETILTYFKGVEYKMTKICKQDGCSARRAWFIQWFLKKCTAGIFCIKWKQPASTADRFHALIYTELRNTLIEKDTFSFS